ncbi:MAG: hypothetical protein HY788_20290 [Deltaproteobacteria bacterium]|nr:hypothetical protein [Deltaproteobacteria bacterium]
MKVGGTLALLVCLGMTAFLPGSQAAFLSVSPTGSFNAQAAGATSITYNIYFNVEGTESFTFISWDFDVVYDTGELANWSASNVVAGGISEAADPPDGTLNHLFFSLGPSTDVTFADAGPHLLASVTFDIINPLQSLDGMPDFSVLSQVGDSFDGFTDEQFQFYQFAGANGADVGRPAPVPDPAGLIGTLMFLLLGSQ